MDILQIIILIDICYIFKLLCSRVIFLFCHLFSNSLLTHAFIDISWYLKVHILISTIIHICFSYNYLKLIICLLIKFVVFNSNFLFKMLNVYNRCSARVLHLVYSIKILKRYMSFLFHLSICHFLIFQLFIFKYQLLI